MQNNTHVDIIRDLPWYNKRSDLDNNESNR